MSVVTRQGAAGPFDADGQPYEVFGSRTAALHSFRLTFPAPIDHEIALIQVLPGGDSEDLSPDADLQPASFPDGRLHVAFQDADPSGEQFGWRVSHSILNNVGARRFQIRDVGCQGKCVRQITLPHSGPIALPSSQPLLALVGFKLFFTGARDHELDRVGIWFRGNDLHIALRDANGDDTFGYLVDFIAIPRELAGFNVSTGIERGTARSLETIPFPSPSRTDFILTGWAFNFKKDDQEILDIGVLRHLNALTVFYADSGGGEEFDWRVEWAHVAPMVFTPG
jgi:hypothetical protein